MRDSLETLIHEAILLECKLPNAEKQLDKTCLSTEEDVCFQATDSRLISKVIYNGIVEFAFNEYEINYSELRKEQKKAVSRRIRYSSDASEETKLKYGFYGEVLFDLILRSFFGTQVLIARGYFYSPIENGEAKGFDAFHLMERDKNIELWFGEAKFYIKYKTAITSVLEKLTDSLSTRYLSRNLWAIINEKNHLAVKNCSQVERLFDRWDDNPDIDLVSDLREEGIVLVYPIFIAYEEKT